MKVAYELDLNRSQTGIPVKTIVTQISNVQQLFSKMSAVHASITFSKISLMENLKTVTILYYNQ